MRRTGINLLLAVLIALVLLWCAGSGQQGLTPESLTSAHGKKVVVLASTGFEDVTWVEKNLPDWHHAIYDMSDRSDVMPGMHPVPKARGHDAMAYLTYIIDHYDDLPTFTAFVQANRTIWKDGAPGSDTVEALNSLQLNFVQNHGYTSLRCSWTPGCPDEVQPWSRRYGSARHWEGAMPTAWKHIFGEHFGRFPGTIGAPSGSQFVLPRWQILRRPRFEYARYRDWLIQTRLSDYDAERILEFLWHIIFERPAIYCPDEYQCACDQFGRC